MKTNRRVESGRSKVESGEWRVESCGRPVSTHHPLPTARSPHSPAPRGILLILVLAVLAMFAMIAVAFVIISNHARDTADSHKRFEQVTDPPEKLLRQAAMQVFRGPKTNPAGTPDPASVMGAHSLLEDIYGNEYWEGLVTAAPTPRITVDGIHGQLLDLPVSGIPATEFSRCIGCVLTIVGNQNTVTLAPDASVAVPGLGLSTRIVGVNPSTSTLQVVGFVDGSLPLPATNALSQSVLVKFTINGVPFSGMGFGYDSATYDLDLTLDTTNPTPTNWHLSSDGADATHWPVALLPNLPLAIYNGSGFTFGGANEDYDAADFQNMLLAAQVPIYGNPSDTHEVTSVHTLPSLHRPALIRYWMNELSVATPGDLPPELLRKIMLRPIGVMSGVANPDHPNFTGSNPNFNPIWNMIDGSFGLGQWDVDNDGDGVPDSVWVDLGMPVRQTADGRLYKPLFAILCVDLDGRVNLNAHGSLPQTDTANYGTAFSLGSAINGSVSTRGQGQGPADVNIAYLLDPNYPSTAFYPTVATNSYRLMNGFNGYQGRYGTDGVIGSALPGSATLDALNANKWFNYGSNYWDFSNINNAGSYGSPPDVYGVGAVGLDIAGRPVYAWMNYGGATPLGYGSGIANSPYELNLDANQTSGQPSNLPTVDNPYSPTELERILRPFDCDAPSLPDRLAQLTAVTPGDPRTSILHNTRHSVTTESWDLPCPNVVTPPSMTTAQRQLLPGERVKHITDLLRARGVPEAQFAELLPPDLLAGLRMNINRPFGNGLDDNGNGVVDDPSAAEAGEQITPIIGSPYAVSYDGSGTVTNSLAARQREARFLYVLACLTVDLQSLNGASHFGDFNETARFLAQWAVNVVDFKDRDSIMTSFDYDPNFANPGTSIAGWSVTPGTSPRVWGCERPELLFSEIVNMHDRRSEDLATEQVDGGEGDGQTAPETVAPATPDPTVDYDESFDQRFRPQGSLFIELYNPWSPAEPKSGDLYSAPNGGVDLTKVDPVGNSPVWRMVIVDQADSGKDPDDSDPTQLPNIEKAIYFAGPTAAPSLPGDGTVEFQPDDNHAARIAPIYPGRYAVIGPGKRTDTTASITYLGFDNAENPGNVQTSPNTTRRIELNPNANPSTAGQVEVYNDGTTDDLASLTIKNPTAIVITLPVDQRLSISEPDGGYQANSPDGTIYAESTGYVPPWDIPLDINSTVSANVKAAILNNGRIDDLKVVYLQRLANPLLPYNSNPADPNYNPYRTIDSMPVDLVAFNGIETKNDPKVTTSTNNQQLYARQRGQHNDAAGEMNLWSKEPFGNSPSANTVHTPPDLTATTFNLKNWPLHHTLGYLNDPYGLPNSTAGYEGDPTLPFPWLTWLNRPYVSQYEIMQVPWMSSSKLLGWYNMEQGSNPYTDVGLAASFPHLTNYFLSKATTSSPQDEELHRVFEYLGVPSPFVGTETQANPNFATGAGHNFRPPFNGISTYREPGKINLNTIYSRWVFDSLKNGSMSNVSWTKFKNSRRGYSGSYVLVPDTELTTKSTLYPTEFGKPFRSFGGADMVPTLDTTATNDLLKYDKEIDATVLREGSTAGTPLFQGYSTAAADNTNRNPYFRYQGIQRLGNLVTTRSNVYAVWITVGYFEVEDLPAHTSTWTPAEIRAVYPDGYALARELGMDTGEIERHRAFYIFDRSIPVGFQRGQDLNIDKAILVDRYIE